MDDRITPTDLSQRFYHNTKTACKFYGLKIGDLEDEIGLPAGHLSRWRREGMRLWAAYRVSHVLRIPIDVMLNGEINEKTLKEVNNGLNWKNI